MRNTVLNLISILNTFLGLLGLRQRRQLGIVYDSVTKQPVDPVIVKLIDSATSKVVGANIANLKGEFGFMASPGVYQIYVQRANYRFPSQKVLGMRDGIYAPIYHGERFEFSGGEDVLTINIPVDPIAPDWNQKAKQRTTYTHPILDYLFVVITSLLFWTTLLMAGTAYAFTRDITWLYVLAPYVAVLLLAIIVPRQRLWGRVRKNNGEPVANVIVEVAHAQLPDITIAKAVTVSGGKFFIRLGPGKYALTVKNPPQPDVNEPPLLTQTIQVGSSGVFNQDVFIP